jgi:hypothetical protein
MLAAGFESILIPIFFALAFCRTSTKADEGGYLGTVLENGAANYVVQMDDGSLLDVEWDSGYDVWSRGDRVILTTESGGGYMYSDDGQTEVDVFPYNPADIGNWSQISDVLPDMIRTRGALFQERSPVSPRMPAML